MGRIAQPSPLEYGVEHASPDLEQVGTEGCLENWAAQVRFDTK